MKKKKSKRGRQDGPRIVTKGMITTQDKVQMLSPSQPHPHVCDEAGRCCWGGAIGLIHYDMWRMIKGGVLKKFGYNTTVELTGKNGAVIFGLGPQTRLPVAFIKLAPYRNQEGAAGHCPFLLWDDSLVSDGDAEKLLAGKMPGLGFWKTDGKPRFQCGLGPFKPIQCQIFPMGRIGESGNDMDVGKWRFFCDTSYCRKCMVTPVRKKGCEFSTAQYLREPGVRVILEYTRDYIDMLTMMARRNMDDDVRQFVARMMFDFDSVLLDSGATSETLEERRPPTPGELMRGVAMVVAGVMNEQERLRKEQDQVKTVDE